jgi:glucan biosynthesis protein
MVNKTSIIVSRKKNIHNGVTFKTHIHISNITENDDRNVKYDFDLSDKFYKL